MKLLALVLGAHGQLGEAMSAQLGARHEVVAYGRQELDVTSATDVRTMISSICPDVIVNCSAYTRVDEAEDHPADALAVNASALATLADVAGQLDATLVHFSTDFVFDGESDRSYAEEDVANPQGAYAASKLLGEWLAADAPRHYVLRVESLFGGLRPTSSVDRMLDAIQAGTEVRAFVDRTVSPSYVEDVVAATDALLTASKPYGLYHCVNTGWTTWSGIAHELARLAGRPDSVIAEIRMADVPLRAPRPKWAALSNAKLTAAGIGMPTWRDALARYVADRAASAEPPVGPPVVPPVRARRRRSTG
jgi:dTDP-4-dehydrorhamnose reductase